MLTHHPLHQVGCEKEAPKELYVTITSDRGLAGGVHSNICKAIRYPGPRPRHPYPHHPRNEMLEKTAEQQANTRIICVGDKSRAFMARYCREHGTARNMRVQGIMYCMEHGIAGNMGVQGIINCREHCTAWNIVLDGK